MRERNEELRYVCTSSITEAFMVGIPITFSWGNKARFDTNKSYVLLLSMYYCEQFNSSVTSSHAQSLFTSESMFH